jgi:fission process protein 1
MVAVKRSVFQGVASMALPAFTIHTAVKQSAKYFNKSTKPFARTWGPTITGEFSEAPMGSLGGPWEVKSDLR